MTEQYNHATILETLMPKGVAYEAHYVGRALYVQLNPETILKACLFRGDNTGYAGLSLTVINKHFGQVDSVIIHFPVYITKNGYSVRKMLSTCMNPSDLVQWDEQLTAEELADIHSQVREYINVFNTLSKNDAML